MRRSQQDLASQPVRNTITNPAMVTKTTGTDTILVNYAANPSFVGATHSTGGIGGAPATFSTMAIATDKAHSGTQSFKLGTCTAAGQAGRKAMTNPAGALKVVKGQKVSWSLWIYSTVAGTVLPYWEGRKVSDNSYVGGGSTAVSIPANQWTYVSGTQAVNQDSYVDGAGAYNLNVNIGDSVWFDDFCITQTDTPVTYFDGSTPAADGYTYSWSGTANNSSSVRKASAAIVRTNLVANPTFKGGTLSNIRTNLLTNPSFESNTGTTDVWTNNVMNPSFRATSGTAEVRKNLITNPSFEAGSGTVDIRTNLATNPSMENTSGTVAARYNLITYPNFEVAGSAQAIRTNLCTNPRGVNAFTGYGTQTVTANVAITGHPEGITTANRVAYGTNSNNPGVILASPITSGQVYTISAWVYHETAPASGTQGFAQSGIASQTPPPAIIQGSWQRLSWIAYTASGTSQLGFRVSGAAEAGSYLITGVLVEARPDLGKFFDGATPAQQNLVTNPSFATNTTGWSPISATLTRVTDQGGDGHAGELAQTITGGARNTAIWLIGSNYSADSYTVSFDVKGTDASFTNVRALLYDNATASIRASATTPLIKDGNFNRYTFNLVADGVFDRVYMEVQGVNIPVGTKSWIDRAQLEKTNTSSSIYYEGTGDFTYAWGGTANASTSLQNATTFSGWGQLAASYRSIMDPKMGTYSGAVSTLGRDGDGIWPGTDLDVIAAKTYTFSAWIKATSVHGLTAGFRWKDAALVTIGSDTNVTLTSQLVVGSWALVSGTATAPALAAKLQLMFRIYETHTPTTFYIDGAICTESQTPVPYFDGSTAASGDFTYAWTGVANTSTSVQQGVGVVESSTGSVAAISSTEWKGTGTKSMRLVTNITTSNDTFTSISGDTGAMRLGMVAGKTYTFSAVCRLAAPLTGTLSIRSRRLVLFYKAAADQNYTEAQSTQAPNTAGETRVSLTFAIPANTTEAFLRLYSGTYAGNGDVWWDNLLVEESPMLGPYFDGTIPAVENLVKTTALPANGLTHTTGVSYAGQTWTRASVPINNVGGMSRQMVALADLRQGERYTVSVTVANDQTTAQNIQLDWADTGYTAFTIQPGETRRISIYSTRTNYDNVYRFSDLDVTSSATEVRSILYKDWVIELGQTAGDYPYTGTGDFTYAWTGTTNASTSVQRGTAVTGVSAPAYLCRAFQSSYKPTIGSKTLRVTATSTSTDVFAELISLLSGYTFKATTTYTLAVDRILPAPLVGASGVLSRVNIGGELAITTVVAPTNVAGRSRYVVQFTTGTDVTLNFVRIYSGTPAGGGDVWFDRLTLEEGITDGRYFDGDTPVTQNLCTNPSFETSLGTWANVAGASTTRDTTQGYSGASCVKITVTASGQGAYFSGGAAAVLPGDVVTTSAWVKGPVGQQFRFDTDYSNSSMGNWVVGTSLTGVAFTGNWQRVSNTVTIPVNYDRVSVGFKADTTFSGDILADAILIEKSSTLNSYFEGTGDFTYAWGGTAHASTSVQRAPAVVGNSASKGGSPTYLNSYFFSYQSIDETGKKIGRWYTPAGSGNSGWRVVNINSNSLNYAAIVANQSYTLMFRYRSSGWGAGQTFDTSLRDPGAGNVVIGNDTARSLNTGWTEYRRTFTALISGLSTTNLYISLPTTPQTSTDGTFDISEWALVPGAYTGPFFDGNSVSSSADLTYAWTGTADASISVLRGNAVSDIANSNGGENIAKHITSTEWSASTGKSLRIIPVGTQPDTSAQIMGSPSSLGSMVPGKTYTVKATFRQTAPQTGSLQPRARGIMFADSVTGWAAAPVVAATNTAGSQTLTHTFTVPAAATWATVRLYNGASGGNGDVWWDDVVMVEGPYTGNYFDGSTAASGDFSYAWSGTANASTSYQKAPNLANWSVESKIAAYVTSTGTLKIEVKDPNGGGGRSAVPMSSAGVNLSVTAGNKYTIKARGRKLDTWTGYNIAGALVGALPLTTSMSDITLTLTAGVGPIYLEHPSGSNTAGTEWEYFGIFNEGDPVTYFDGDTSGFDGLIHRWTGTPNASQSQQIGATVSGYGLEPNIKPWALPDGAMRTVNISGTTHSLQVPNSTINGRTYTVLVRAKAYRSGNFRVYGLANAPLVTLTTSYGWYRVTGVATGTTLYFSTEGQSGSGFDMSHLMVVEGTYTGGYVDGYSYGARWEGTAHAATSLGNPSSLESMTGKPLFSGTTAGNFALSPTGVPDTSARTIYTLVDNILDVPTAGMSIVLSYGNNALDDTVANKYLTIRQQSIGGPFNTNFVRRTGGVGSEALYVPSSGRQILIGGINGGGFLFSGFNNSALVTDNVVVAMPHERIIIGANTSYHNHVITYVFAGFHNDSMRAEIIKHLALKHNVTL